MRVIRMIWAVAGLALLVGCGADGEPEAPSVSVSGEARIGVSGKL